jgi:hypothetical protein
MVKSITPKPQDITFEEFKALFLARKNESSLLDKSADYFDAIPTLLKITTNFDPTGIAGSIAQILESNKATREQENILEAVYYLTIAFRKHERILKNMKESFLRQNLPELTHLYFDYSRRVFHSSKIENFKNIWLNGLIKSEIGIDEKHIVFETISELSTTEILILKYFFKRQCQVSFEKREPINADEIGKVLGIDNLIAQQYCLRLQGRGFLFDYGIGRFDYPGPINFIIMDNVSLIIEFITEPSIDVGTRKSQ